VTKTEPDMMRDSDPGPRASIGRLEQSTLEAVRNFVDTLNGMFPDVRDDDRRRKVIDSAFNMVEQLVGTSNDFARNIVTATEHALDEFDKTHCRPKTDVVAVVGFGIS